MPQPIPLLTYEQAIAFKNYPPLIKTRVRVTLDTILKMVNDSTLQPEGGSVYRAGQMEANPEAYRYPVVFHFNSIGLVEFEVDLAAERASNQMSNILPQE